MPRRARIAVVSIRHHTALILVAVCLCIGALCASGCCAENAKPLAGRVVEPVTPAPPDLSQPKTAVHSYLDWVSFSYRLANSEISSMTMTPWEGVRVDSYIQKNRQEGRGIDQRLTAFEIDGSSREGTRALVVTDETWTYRYFRLSDLAYDSPRYTVSYDATYTVVREAERWLVDKVEATPRGEVK